MNEDQEEKVISFAEVLVVGQLIFYSDLFDLFSDLLALTVVGIAVTLFSRVVTVLVWLCVQLYLYFKGVRGLYYLIGSLIDLVIPFAQTITFLITVYVANRPRLAKVAEVTSSLKGGKVAGLKSQIQAEKSTVGKMRKGYELYSEVKGSLSLEGERRDDTSDFQEEEEGESQKDEREQELFYEATGDPSEELRRELFEPEAVIDIMYGDKKKNKPEHPEVRR